LEEPAIMPSSDSNINWQNIQPFDDLDAGLWASI
jgi:hypothetical protein